MIVETLTFVPDVTWILTAVLGLVTFIMVKHILLVRSLPPGPFPLPFAGNILALRGEGISPQSVMGNLQHVYKDIFTFWLGDRPTVVVSSWDLCREALITKRNDFSGRIKRRTIELFMDGDEGVAFSDYGPCWETLRKILTSAVRKYAVSEKLAHLVHDVVDMTRREMVEEGKPVDANSFVYLILYNVLASSAFGKRFEMDNPEFLELRTANENMNETFGNGLPSDAMPVLKYFYSDREREIKYWIDKFRSYIRQRYYEHKQTYQKGEVRDFTDAVLAARNEAEEESKDNLQHLTDGNLVNLLVDLFSAGSDTTRITLLWLLLIISDKPEVQKRMHEEIDENIGSRPPVQEDRKSCPFVQSVITETLRFRPVLDFTLEHKTVCDTELGGYKIPRDTSCLFNIISSHFDETHWDDPEKFKADRFLEPDGSFTNSRLTAYLPFGLGRRACPGEKLALADVFLIITRLLQNNSFELENGPGSVNLEKIYKAFGNNPAKYKLIIRERQIHG